MWQKYASVQLNLEGIASEDLEDALQELNYDSSSYWERIKGNLLARSSSKDIDAAIKEWHLVQMWVDTHANTCELCGKHPLKFQFQIQNRINKNTLIVGSECVWNYLEIPNFSKDDIRRTISLWKAKANAISKGQAPESALSDAQKYHELEKVAYELIARIASPSDDLNFEAYYSSQYSLVNFLRALKLDTATSKALISCANAQLELQKVTRYTTLGASVQAIGSQRSTKLQTLEHVIALMREAFSVGSAADFTKLCWEEIRNHKIVLVEQLEAEAAETRKWCQQRYSGRLQALKEYPHLSFLLQAGIIARHQLINDEVAKLRRWVFSDKFFQDVAANPKALENLRLRQGQEMRAETSRMEAAALALISFLKQVDWMKMPNGYWAKTVAKYWKLKEIRDSAGIEKALLRAAEDGVIDIEEPLRFGVGISDRLEKKEPRLTQYFEEEVDDIARLRLPYLYERMSQSFGVDVRALYRAMSRKDVGQLEFCTNLLEGFQQGRIEKLTAAQMHTAQLVLGNEKVPHNCWDFFSKKLMSR